MINDSADLNNVHIKRVKSSKLLLKQFKIFNLLFLNI